MKNRRWHLVLWSACLALALLTAVRLWKDAFPVAAVQFSLTRDQAQTRLASFTATMGAPLGEYRSAIHFGETVTAKNYIEREFGPARLADAARRGIDIWYWTVRWFKPGQREEYQAWSDQAGGIVGYWHKIEEERALPKLSEAQARALAENFLRTSIPQHPWGSLRFIESSSEVKPARTDYTFTWEQGDLRLGSAPYQLFVTVQGNEIGLYEEQLKVPEGWTREYERQRSVNELCLKIAGFFSVAVLVAGLVLFVRAIRNDDVRWETAVPWGWVAAFAAVAVASQLNGIPDLIYEYPTNKPWAEFVTGSIFTAFLSVLVQVLGFWLLLVVADTIYRERLPGKSSFRRALGREALRDPETVRALGVGIAFAVFSLAYICVFYSVGQRCGVWSPIEIEYSKTLSGWMPWVEAAQTGLSASFTEEMIFRVGALLIFWQVFRVRWLAVVLSAATWGFLHSSYPQMPGYVRGIELTLVGIVWGTLLIRYGIVATLTAHYLYDCWLGSMIAYQSSSWENKIGAVLVSVWPLGLFIWACCQPQSAALEPETARVRDRQPLLPAPIRDWRFIPLALDRRKITAILIGSIAALALCLLIPKPQDPLAGLGKFDLSRTQIETRADELMREQGYSPEGYHRVADNFPYLISALPNARDYLLEHGSLRALAALYNKEWPDLLWQVRYFRFLQNEEFTVLLDAHGDFVRWSHTVLDEAPGAALAEPEALQRAAQMLARVWKLDMTRQQLVQERPVQQEHRRDWHFVFDQHGFGWGEAQLRTAVQLQGAEVMRGFRYVQIPEAWIAQHTSSFRSLVSQDATKAVSMGEYTLIAALLILVIKKHLVPWRRAFLCALFPLALKLVDQLDHAPWFFAEYSTATPLPSYFIGQIGTMVRDLILTYLGAVIAIGAAFGFLHWAWGWTADQLTLWPKSRGDRALFWRDTLVIAIGSVALFQTLAFIRLEMLGWLVPAKAADFPWWHVEEWMPCIGAATEAAMAGYHQMIHAAIYASVLRLIWLRSPRWAWALPFLYPLLGVLGEQTAMGFFCELACSEVTMLATVWLVLRVWKFNGVVIFLSSFLASIYGSILLFLENGGPAYQWQAMPLLAGGILFAAAGLWLHKRDTQAAAEC